MLGIAGFSLPLLAPSTWFGRVSAGIPKAKGRRLAAFRFRLSNRQFHDFPPAFGAQEGTRTGASSRRAVDRRTAQSRTPTVGFDRHIAGSLRDTLSMLGGRATVAAPSPRHRRERAKGTNFMLTISLR